MCSEPGIYNALVRASVFLEDCRSVLGQQWLHLAFPHNKDAQKQHTDDAKTHKKQHIRAYRTHKNFCSQPPSSVKEKCTFQPVHSLFMHALILRASYLFYAQSLHLS